MALGKGFDCPKCGYSRTCAMCSPDMAVKKQTRLAEFEQHEGHVKERMVTYGHPSQNFGRIAAMKSVIADCKHPEARHALEMIAEAIARLVECPEHVDSWSNIAGYARCGIMVTEPKPRQGDNK